MNDQQIEYGNFVAEAPTLMRDMGLDEWRRVPQCIVCDAALVCRRLPAPPVARARICIARKASEVMGKFFHNRRSFVGPKMPRSMSKRDRRIPRNHATGSHEPDREVSHRSSGSIVHGVEVLSGTISGRACQRRHAPLSTR